jgi:organic radical activating enzyme
MAFKVNEIFYSLQGEGHFTGTPAVFLRLSGCNLACPFCDTTHQTFSEMTEEAILSEISRYPSRHLVVTGGEPAMQLTAEFVELLHQHGYFVQVETNGTLPLPENVDWVTCSPKAGELKVNPMEIKLLFMGDATDAARIERYASIPARYHYLQPCDHTLTDPTAKERNAATLASCIDFIKSHPLWRLSLQTHKLIDIR